MRLQELSDLLAGLATEGDAHNHLVLESGPAFFVVTGGAGRPQLRVVAASQALLPDEVKLGYAQVGALRSAGFAKDPDQRGLSRTVAAKDAPALARQLLELFHSGYGQDPTTWRHRLTQSPEDPTRNPALREAIRAASKAKTMASRNALYRALLEADLLLALDAEGRPAVVDEISGFDCFACFSEHAALSSHDPRLMPYRVVRGYELWPELAALRPGAVQINPKTRLGGELYRNEVDSLAAVAGSPTAR